MGSELAKNNCWDQTLHEWIPIQGHIHFIKRSVMNEWICLLWWSLSLSPLSVPPGPSRVPQPLQGRHPGCQIFLLSCHQNLRPPACVCLVSCQSEARQRQVSTSCSSPGLLMAQWPWGHSPVSVPAGPFGFYPVHAGGQSSKSLNLALTAEIPAALILLRGINRAHRNEIEICVLSAALCFPYQHGQLSSSLPLSLFRISSVFPPQWWLQFSTAGCQWSIWRSSQVLMSYCRLLY